ncbi:DUF3307 domain-containing protein [Croceivirga sp. JEA036]|uniref:DUF3307 domain-containing protein n=1 Tax=Croceivirga sp. JEA036 TaxID=2721162 RepID=UPI00143B95C5|nr:DUF3307 domain-containing protein [Croceivirga sp. JEA036]NJB37861.1 DUF3307 domain-containing protein [Croceivirga sp. JEA036]
MTLLVLQLLLAHFIGDFILQPAKWVVHKKAYKLKSKYLYYHITVHFLLLLLCTVFNYFGAIALIVISHLIIDGAKLVFTTPKNERLLFILDQLLHLAFIAIAVHLYYPFNIPLHELISPKLLLLLLFLILVSFVSAILIKILLAPYIQILFTEEDKTATADEGASLPNAGKYIGILERLFVFGFILANQWAAIGLLIAAKSVFRFGDLNKGNNRKLTEYVLIGTLLSFGLAILSGLGYKAILSFIP